MAAARNALARTALGSSLKALPAAGRFQVRPCVVLPPSALPRTSTSLGFHSSALRLSKDTTWASKGTIGYRELKPISNAPTGEVTIIDVREPDEVSAGMIPSAVNVPLTQFEKAFAPNGGADFQQKFAFSRPEFNDQLVLYCRSGKRSAQALEVAKKNGWQK